MADEPTGGTGFTDREMRLIFERAGKLGAASGRDRRFSLAELQAMGAEAGLDPADVAEAAAAVRVVPDTHRFLGAPTRFQSTLHLDHRLSESTIADAVARIRDVSGFHGESRVVPGGVEWKARSATAAFIVSFTPKGAGTRVSVLVAPGDAAVLTAMGGGLIGIAAGYAAAAFVGLQLGAPPAITAAVGVFGTVAAIWGTTRVLWTRAAKRWRARAQAVVSAIATTAEHATDPPTE